jgi:hypothetical protein
MVQPVWLAGGGWLVLICLEKKTDGRLVAGAEL